MTCSFRSETDTPTFEIVASVLHLSPRRVWHKPAFDTRSCPNAEKCTSSFLDSFAYRTPKVLEEETLCGEPHDHLVHREPTACGHEAHSSPDRQEQRELRIGEDQGIRAIPTILVACLPSLAQIEDPPIVVLVRSQKSGGTAISSLTSIFRSATTRRRGCGSLPPRTRTTRLSISVCSYL